ncbi:RNA 3'-terminal phosphate cyclase isoform X2 [Bradysia coprophila]|uniref:RNA 3'-terminal phosphate cyclase isoform X2 n=1 Tax=Bradysia coprophila TaxID=38358 RepID=UPI00187D9422|nr:RNA 3'-terminal phosphate cyclase isoform X2 [Bradysia coprophila]
MGGQILRMALCCSALTGKPIKVSKIRAGRQKGGLAAQHLKGLELLRDMCNAKVIGASLGSTEIEFHPDVLKGGKYYADTQTAGSVALLLQVALPVALFCNSPLSLELKGGTNCEMAPQMDFMTEIFRPNLEKFGATFDFDLRKRGYFPRGGGHCVIDIKPVIRLNSTEICDFGEVDSFFGWSFVAGTLPIKMANEFAEGAKSEMKKLNLNKSINIEAYKESADVASGNCSGIILGCNTNTNCILGGSALGSRKESCFDSGKRAATEIVNLIPIRACVDDHVQDQLIIFMALANGLSRIRTGPLTLHTKTAIHIAELITNVKFTVLEDGSTNVIECNGIGLENKFLNK